ncbi:MAG TPA: redoxin domain-containing protein [Halothiobacillaceae bacterium]|nr:redoxin domain-containing protein [Halothiobacillaceae bacterium]
MVNFWAAWCPACVEKLPSLARLSQSFEDDLRMCGVAYQRSAAHLRDFRGL